MASPVYLGESNLELLHYINHVATSSSKVQVDGEIPLVGPGQGGRVQVTLQILNSTEAASQEVILLYFTISIGWPRS
ncbi:hypothetical protein BdWA1_001197 [Babesia duncani]|uniref:Uncharacterized protein n=1 Tax=Babesia duncani TaxID=323732 RepID=A0AAD9UQI7_9APIC|nr:hypothetical protein BdWA1_001197 [Babesia duncani]